MATQLSNAIHQALGTNGPFHSTGSPPSGLPSDSSESLQSQAKASEVKSAHKSAHKIGTTKSQLLSKKKPFLDGQGKTRKNHRSQEKRAAEAARKHIQFLKEEDGLAQQMDRKISNVRMRHNMLKNESGNQVIYWRSEDNISCEATLCNLASRLLKPGQLVLHRTQAGVVQEGFTTSRDIHYHWSCATAGQLYRFKDSNDGIKNLNVPPTLNKFHRNLVIKDIKNACIPLYVLDHDYDRKRFLLVKRARKFHRKEAKKEARKQKALGDHAN